MQTLLGDQAFCDVANQANQKRTGRRMICERPFNCRNVKTNYIYKAKTRNTLKSLFARPGDVVPSATEHVVTPSSTGLRNTSATKSSGSVNRHKTNRGATKLFNDNGSLTVDLTKKLKVRLEDRKHLEEHEIDLIHVLLDSYLRSDIKSKHDLTKAEKRLFGQFAVRAFSKVPDGQHLSLSNFPRAKPIQITQLPHQYKQGEEEHNKKLFKRRIKKGKAWMRHLPGAFNDDLIATMFIEIDEEIVRKTLRKYHNNQLRLNAEDSASLKSFAGLSDNAYVKLGRGLFLFY